jgi:DNA repair protein RAD16
MLIHFKKKKKKKAANHVFLLEPWWNPAVEMQAIHRAYRIGQNKPVFATRFVTLNSVEEKMMMLQTKKQLVFEGTMDGSAASLSKLTAEDLAFLFHA